ncbi:MAG: alpha/beta fold hydrolase, partial [candidate division Zixibacteria bacterium]
MWSKAIHMFYYLILSAVGLFLLIAALLYWRQPSMVFVPFGDIEMTPEMAGMEYEELFLEVGGSDSVHTWFIEAKSVDGNPQTPVVLFCHGNAGNMSHRVETAEMLVSLGASVLMFDYRGYGRSSGKPTEENCYGDARAAYDWLLAEKSIAPETIIIFGRSLGGAVAVDLASKNVCKGLVVESSFSSIVDMGKMMFPYLPV